MLRLALVASLLVSGLVAAGNSPGWRNLFPNTRIKGGTPAQPGEFPFQASLQIEGQHICAGTIVSENHIVTSATCSIYLARYYTVVVGVTNITDEGQTRQVAQKQNHPDFGYNLKGIPVNDIAVYTVSEPFELNDNVQPAQLPSPGDEVPNGTEVTITGWGLTEDAPSSDELLQVQVPVRSPTYCDELYSDNDGIPDGQVCAGVPGNGKTPCIGDYGGPVSLDGVLVGVVSWSRGCSTPIYIGVYTDVLTYIDFINSVIG